MYNCQAFVEIIALLRPFFPRGWDCEIVPLDKSDQSYILTSAAIALNDIDLPQALRLEARGLRLDIARGHWGNVAIALRNLGDCFRQSRKLATQERLISIALQLSEALDNKDQAFALMLELFAFASITSDLQRADCLWMEVDPIRRPQRRDRYLPGHAEKLYADERWRRGKLAQEHLAKAEALARSGRNRRSVRELAVLRGKFHLQCGEIQHAIDSLVEAVRMAREVGQEDVTSEALLALARIHAGEGFDVHGEAERLDGVQDDEDALYVAELWRELGETERAIAAARRAHKWAVADGEPYVFRYELNRTRALLEELGTELPEVPTYNPASDPPFDWEADVQKMIEKLKAKRAKREGERA